MIFTYMIATSSFSFESLTWDELLDAYPVNFGVSLTLNLLPKTIACLILVVVSTRAYFGYSVHATRSETWIVAHASKASFDVWIHPSLCSLIHLSMTVVQFLVQR